MTHTAEDIERIAKGLTKAQRRVVMREGVSDEPMVTVHVMMRKGLLYHHIDSPNGRAGPMRLTEAGRAVRAHLIAQEGGE